MWLPEFIPPAHPEKAVQQEKQILSGSTEELVEEGPLNCPHLST